MNYITLGRSDLRVSVIGQGTGQFGTKAWGYGSRFNDADIVEIIQELVNSGVNLFDTAETYGYGVAERLLGRALEGHKRDEIVVISKVAPWNLSYDRVIKSVNGSLERLNMRYIDLHLVHYPNPFVPLKKTMRALELLVRQRSIRYIGVSNFSPPLLKRAQEALSFTELVLDEIEYILISRFSERFTIPYCGRNGTGVIAYSQLAAGFLLAVQPS